MVIEVFTEAVWTGLLESVTVTAKAEVPLDVGVPEITPVEELSVSPAGKLPAVTAHVYPGVPPEASNPPLYCVPVLPAGSRGAPTASAPVDVGVDAATAIEYLAEAVCAGLPESVTVAVKVKVPLACGVPAIAPEGASETPAGS